MYQQAPSSYSQPLPGSGSLGYTSPPPSHHQDPYRASPIPMQTRSPYTSSALSPPSSSSSGFSPMPASSSRHAHSGQQGIPQYASRSGGARYPNSAQGYSQQPFGMPPLPIPPQQTPQQKFKGTLAPGTIIKVGESHVRIERYLSEGGYAHVYLTTSERPVYPPIADGAVRGRWGEKGYTQHCLKRIAFEDEKVWVDVRQEIEVMKALPPNPHLTQYLASAHSRLPSGGYEVFILMEFCSGGGIIDLLNKRLRDRLKEIEILNIFTDICEAVAAMHHLKQPLLHRDLKIENVLSAPTGQPASSQRPTPLIFKLCDFGSTTFPSSHPPQNKAEADALAQNLNKHTTLQYRSPEMVEPMLGWAVGLPSDVWALGVLLYKLCYYTTPFEEHGTLAIVNAKYTFPQYPVYSPKIQHLIDHPARRPSVFEILNVAHEMSGTRPEISYPLPSRSFPPSSQSTSKPKSNSTNLLDFTYPTPTPTSAQPAQPDLVSSVQPQRRGRPTREPSNRPMSAMTPPSMPSPSMAPVPQPQTQPAEAISIPKPRMQVTGEQVAAKDETRNSRQNGDQGIKQASTDAFGMPAMTASKSPKAASGFGDSFGSNNSKGVAGISQRFGGAGKRSDTAASGFSDSFTIPRPEAKSTPSFRVASPETTLPPSSSADQSFEIRFPSIDTLDSSDAFSPRQPAKSVSDLISPIISPPATITKPILHSRQSMMGHLTGDNGSKHESLSVKAESGPQPRSTQVTGTAFKREEKAAASERGQKVDYFGTSKFEEKDMMRERDQAERKSPVDLMTGDAYSSMTSNSRQNSQSTGSGSNLRPAVPSGLSRTRIPNITEKASSTSVTEADSSDEEDVVPESASGMGMRPSNQGDLSARASSGYSGSTISRPTPITLAPKPQLGNLRQKSSDRVRPQSMFVPSSQISPSSSQPTSATPSGSSGRPGHVRKGSITDIVSRFETLNSPSSISSGRRSNGDVGEGGAEPVKEISSTGLGRKPSVASKPQALRKATSDLTATAKSPSAPIETSSIIDKPRTKPQVSDKPTTLAKSSRHGDMPSVAGYSKSSSGRSFPISRIGAAASSSFSASPRSEIPIREAQEEKLASKIADGAETGTGSKSGSPEKQQSVGSLIARWNQTK